MVIRLKQYALEDVSSQASNVAYDVEFVCKLVHQVNDAYRVLIGESPKGDWDTLEDGVKDSTRKGVAFILSNPESTPKEIHDKWVSERTCEGWSFGQVMDETAKTHPCLTPYEELPVEHRIKDHLFGNTVKSVLNALSEDQRLMVSTECDCGYTPGIFS